MAVSSLSKTISFFVSVSVRMLAARQGFPAPIIVLSDIRYHLCLLCFLNSTGRGPSTSGTGSWPLMGSAWKESHWVKPSICCRWPESRSPSRSRNKLTVGYFTCQKQQKRKHGSCFGPLKYFIKSKIHPPSRYMRLSSLSHSWRKELCIHPLPNSKNSIAVHMVPYS